jgi:CDP-diacylglycerol--glycerol-3-phosphate 3-phosphatidyltransferase
LRASLAVLAAVLAAAFASMAAFAVLRKGKDEDAERKGSRLFLGAGDFLIHWFLWAISPAERFFLSHGATPDHFNAAGLVFGLASGVLIGLGHLELGGWAIALSGVSDILDGRIARARGVASPYGKFIDSTLDRFVETFTFLGFAWYLRGTPIGAFLATAALAGSLLVSYAQARGETVGVSGSGGLMQRAERMVLSCLVCLFDPALSARLGRREGTVVVVMLALMAVTTFGTAIYRTIWIARRLAGR